MQQIRFTILHQKLKQEKGGNFAKIFCHCYFHWALAWSMWQDYKNLYNDNERIKLLNDCGSAFFLMVRESFNESIILTLTRLTDPCTSMGHENMTLKQFENELDTDTANTELQGLINDLNSKTEFARKIRNKQISHTDLLSIIDEDQKIEPPLNSQLEEALDSANRVFQYVVRMVVNEEILPKPGFDGKDALFTLNMLYRGNEAFRTELSKGEPTIPPDWVMKDLNK